MEIEKICRTCLSLSGPLLSIYDGAGGGGTISDMLSNFTKTKPKPADNLPEKVCLACISEINHCYSFKLKCENSNRMLRQLLPDALPDEADIGEPVKVQQCHKFVQTIGEEVKQVASVELQTIKEDKAHRHVQTKVQTGEMATSALNHKQKESSLKRRLSGEGADEIESEQHGNEIKLELNDGADDDNAANPENDPGYGDDNVSYFEISYLPEEDQHGEDKVKNEAEEGINDNENGDAEIVKIRAQKVKLKCPNCAMSFGNVFSLQRHMLKRHDLTIEEQPPYMCPLCGKSFSLNCYLIQHMVLHSGKFKCDECANGYYTKAELNMHKRTHTGDQPFFCTFCSMVFTTSDKLVKHKRLHTFTCERCSKKFTTFDNLVKHKRLHTGKRRYGCEICFMRFTAWNLLKDHQRTHIDKKPYRCIFCSKEFSQMGDYHIHERTAHCALYHKRYKCYECDRVFSSMESLGEHKATHLLAYVCNECNQMFETKDELTRHMIDEHNRKTLFTNLKSVSQISKTTKSALHLFLKRKCSESIDSKEKPSDSVIAHNDIPQLTASPRRLSADVGTNSSNVEFEIKNEVDLEIEFEDEEEFN